MEPHLQLSVRLPDEARDRVGVQDGTKQDVTFFIFFHHWEIKTSTSSYSCFYNLQNAA